MGFELLRLVRSAKPALAFLLLASGMTGICSGQTADEPAPEPAENSSCDAGLQPTESPLGYRDRGDRCEGLYRRPVANTRIRLVGVTTGSRNGDNSELRIHWRATEGETIRLRAQSLRRSIAFRMDSRRPAADSSFDWTANLLPEVGLDAHSVGIVGWVEKTIARADGSRQQLLVYIPVSWSPLADVRRSDYVITVLPTVRLQDLFVTVTLLDKHGDAVRAVHESNDLLESRLSAHVRFQTRLPFETLPKPGLYAVEFAANVDRSKTPLSMEFLLQHAPAPGDEDRDK